MLDKNVFICVGRLILLIAETSFETPIQKGYRIKQYEMCIDYESFVAERWQRLFFLP